MARFAKGRAGSGSRGLRGWLAALVFGLSLAPVIGPDSLQKFAAAQNGAAQPKPSARPETQNPKPNPAPTNPQDKPADPVNPAPPVIPATPGKDATPPIPTNPSTGDSKLPDVRPEPLPPEPPAPAGASRPLDEAVARQAFSLADQWVMRGLVEDYPLPIYSDDLVAIAATLRLDGVKMGYAVGTRVNPMEVISAGASPIGRNLLPILQRSVAGAQSGAFITWLNLREQAEKNKPQQFASTTERQMLDLQFGMKLERVALEKIEQLPDRISIGRHGLALYDMQAVAPPDSKTLPGQVKQLPEDKKWAWAFPGFVTTGGQSLQSQIHLLMQQLRIPLDQFNEIGVKPRYQLYRFQVIHMVKIAPDKPAELLYRGDVLTPVKPLSGAGLADLGRDLAGHLVKRQLNDGHFLGMYLPSSDEFKPRLASLHDEALACYALARYATVPGLDEAEARHVALTARLGLETMLEELVRVNKPISDRWGPTEASMALMALLQTPGTGDMVQHREQLVNLLMRMIRTDGRVTTLLGPKRGEQPKVVPMYQARVAAALVMLYHRTRQPEILQKARQVLAVGWGDLKGGSPTALMPWIAYAEFDLARLDLPTVGLLKLREAAAEYWQLQIKAEMAGEGREFGLDSVGGLKMGGSIYGEPTIQSAAPLAMLGRALSVDKFVPRDDQVRWLLDAGLGARYLHQLTMRPQSGYYLRNPGQANGGVRMSMWDNRQTLSGTAVSLLAVADIQHGIADIEQRRKTEAAAVPATQK